MRNSLDDIVLGSIIFTGGLSGTSISSTSSSSAYRVGNVLSTNFDSGIPYTGSSIVTSSSSFGRYGQYFTYKSSRVFILAADVSVS